MHCTTCKTLVTVNNTGTCLGCQRGFVKEPQEDSHEYHQRQEEKILVEMLEKQEKDLEKIEKELANAYEIASTAQMDACQQTKNGQEMGNGNDQEKPTQESEEES